MVIASDHAGFDLKQILIEHLSSLEKHVIDVGTYSAERTDYPDHAHAAAQQIKDGEALNGILICGSGNGVQMSANKHAGVRCGLAWKPEIAALAKQHNDANLIAIPARFIDIQVAKDTVDAFLGSEFEGGRHKVRVEKIELKESTLR